jgi:hypothetical protein
MPLPPAALLSVEGGDPVEGDIGSFTGKDYGSDSPWLPGAPIHVGSGEPLMLTLAEPVGIEHWVVNRSPADRLDQDIVGMAEGSGPVRFPAPPAGAWSVHVGVRFEDNLGSAAYYWRMDVD